MHAGQVAGLGYFPNGNERALVEIDGVDERVHASIKPESGVNCSDVSRSIDRIVA
jgi:hypothetical protein